VDGGHRFHEIFVDLYFLRKIVRAGGLVAIDDNWTPSVRTAVHSWHHSAMQSVYEAAGGSDGLFRLAEAWHARVMADDLVSHAFGQGVDPDHTERLAAYWAEALGGPTTYSDIYGDETSVVRIHSGNGLHEEMDRRAIACFDQALEDVGVAAEPLRRVLHDYFTWATTTAMARYHESADDVPEGLTIPRWSWNGLQR
jgi:hemoglobin